MEPMTLMVAYSFLIMLEVLLVLIVRKLELRQPPRFRQLQQLLLFRVVNVFYVMVGSFEEPDKLLIVTELQPVRVWPQGLTLVTQALISAAKVAVPLLLLHQPR
jgi:hypothetical protein